MGGPRGAAGAANPVSGAGGVQRPIQQPGVSGPEEVMSGASFQVMVNNPSGTPLSTTLQVDTSVLGIESAGGEGGRIGLTVPPRSMAPVMLKARADVGFADTEVSLDAGEPMRLRVRNPNQPAPDEAGDAPSRTAGDNDEPVTPVDR